MPRLPLPRFSLLDFKGGFRMLARYPGLTAIGTFALALAIALGTLYFEGLSKWKHPRLPVPDPARVVSIRNWNLESVSQEPRTLHDFGIWRERVRTIDHLGAAIPFVRNLATEDGRVEPVDGAEVTASAFSLMGVKPLLGRTLTRQDEHPGEPAVVVIGETLWETRFNADPDVLGRTIHLGTSTATVVGVMPERFGFPVSQRLWTPMRIDPVMIEPRSGPLAMVFGRLAPGASMKQANAELGAIGGRIARESPETHEHIRPLVTTYLEPLSEGGEARIVRTVLYGANAVFLLLLAIISANVATLVFTRTATRSWEITVRSALGASRGRIVTQLFTEALVLTGLAAVLGLLLAKLALVWGLGLLAGGGALPFWIDDSVSFTTVLYAALLTLVGAAVVGILPALRITRIDIQGALRSGSAARSGLRFGGFWTSVVVVQVAITVAFIPIVVGGASESNRFSQRAEGIGADRYLTASVDMDREEWTDETAFATGARRVYAALEERLLEEPGVERVAFADRLPVEDQFKYRIAVDTVLGAPATGLRTSTLVQVSRGFFDAFGTSVVSGRVFQPLDFETGRVMIVNESFARSVFGGLNPIGQRVRVLAGENLSLAGDDWYEVAGVVRDFGWQLPRPEEQAAMYLPRAPRPGSAYGLAVRVADPEAFAPRLRAIASGVDPTLRLTDVQPLASVGGGEATLNWGLTSVVALVSLIVLLLSATGIHALMSFIVARRTREIGIRAALGARPRSIITGIFSRAFLQIGAGVLAGSALASLTGLGSLSEILVLLGADAVMLLTGLLACAVPLRRALSIDPSEALRAET